MLVDSQSNIVKEAQCLGVKVTSKKTFLTFDKENAVKNDFTPGSRTMSRRRFTTTDLVMNKELLDRVRSLHETDSAISGELVALSENSSPSPSHDHDQSDDKRASHCSQATWDFDYSPLRQVSSLQQYPLMVQTPQVDSQSCSSSPGDSGFTTVMVRNIPNRYNQDSIVDLLRSMGFKFNFFYCPIDRNSRANCGYFFVNLISHEMAISLLAKFEGFQLPAFRSSKVCSGCWARIQGYSANVDHYFNSPVSRLNREFRPRVFDVSGKEVLINSMETQSSTHLQERKVFVGGLSPQTTAQAVEDHLSQFGPIEDVSIILDSGNRTSRGFCFVTFKHAEDAKHCVNNKQSHFIDGRSLGIRPYTK